MADPKKNNTIVDGIHGITNAIDTKNQSQKEELELFLGDNGNICSVLKEVLQQLENGININTINDESLGKKGGDDLSDEAKKVKYLNAGLKTSAKNINDLKSDLSDRVGFAVLANKLDDHFAALLPLIGIKGKTKDTKKEGKTKDKGGEKKGGGVNLPFMKTFHKAVDGFKSIPGKITSSVKGVVGGIKTAITAPFKAVGSFFSKGLGMIKGVFTAIPNMFGKAINGLKEGFGKVIGGIKNVITAPFKAIGSVFSKIGGGIKSLFGGGKKKGGPTNINAVAIIAGDATGAVEYTKSFMKINKMIQKMKPVDIDKLKKTSDDFKKWGESFNKNVLSIKLNEATIKSFEKKMKSTAHAINRVNFIIDIGWDLNSYINKKLGALQSDQIFVGLKNYISGTADLVTAEKINESKIQSQTNAILAINKNIIKTSLILLIQRPFLAFTNKLYGKDDGYFIGIRNYIKSANTMSNLSENGISKVEKLSIGILSISKNLMLAVTSMIKQRIPLGLINLLYGKSDPFKGIKKYMTSLGDLTEMKEINVTQFQKVSTDIMTLVKDVFKITGLLILQRLPLALVSFLYAGKFNPFNGFRHYIARLHYALAHPIVQKQLKKVQPAAERLADVTKNIWVAAKSILLAYIPLKIINLLFKNEKSNVFDGLVNYAKTLNKKIVENKEFPSGQKGKKLDKNISQFTHITKGLKKFAAQVILMAASMLLITPVLMILGPVLNKGLDRLSDTMKSIGKVLKTMKQNLKIGTILLGTLCLILLMPFIVLFTALMIPLLLLTGLAAILTTIKFDRILTKLVDGINRVLKKMDMKMVKNLLKAILVETLLIVFTILLLLATFFLVLALPFTVVSILTMLAAMAVFALLMVVGKIAKKCLKGILATILASIALVIMGVALLIATIAMAAVALIIVAVGPQILLALLALVVLFALIFVVGLIAPTVMIGAGATALASIAIAIMGICMLVAVVCLAKISEIIMSTGPAILLSLVAIVVLFGLVIGLGFAAIFALPMSLAAAITSVAIALMAVSMLAAVVSLAKVAVIMLKAGTAIMIAMAMVAAVFGLVSIIGVLSVPVLIFAPMILLAALVMVPMSYALATCFANMADFPDMSKLVIAFTQIALIFTAIAVAGLLALPVVIFAPMIMIAALAMIPMSYAIATAVANMAQMPDLTPIAASMLALVVVFGAVIAAGALGLLALPMTLILGLTVGAVAKTVQKALIKFMAASVVASMFKPQPLVKGIMALALLTDIVRVLNFKPLKEKFKELESAVKHFPKPATALSLTLAMSLFKKDPIVSGLKALFELSKIQLFPFGGLKKKFKELSDGIKKAPDTKHIGKLTEAMDAFKNIDTSGVVNFATSFGSAFDSLTDSTKTIDELSNSIHSLNSELKALSKNGGAVNILKDIQSNAGEATIKDPGIQSAQMEGTAQGEAQAANGKPDKTLYDVCEALNNISNLINQLVSKSSSWMDGGKNERTYEYKAKAGS